MKTYKLAELSNGGDFFQARDEACFFEKIHTHDYYEMEYIYDGRGVQIIDGVAREVCAGDLLLILPSATHSYYSVTDMKILNCGFSEAAFADLKHAAKSCVPAVSLGAEDRDAFEKLAALLEAELERADSSYSVCKAYLAALFSIFSRNAGTGEPSPFWQQIISYIAASPAEVTLSEVCRRAHLSKTYFCRKFKSRFGVTFTEYTAHLKIQHSKQLLLRSELSVTEIMEESGYSSSKLFYKHFKKYTGTTPARYRAGSRTEAKNEHKQN